MSTAPETHSAEVLAFWFGDALASPAELQIQNRLWFGLDPHRRAEFDAAIAARFGDWPDRALGGEFDDWLSNPLGRLALILVLDQFPRNLYRDSARAFAYDDRARTLTEEGIRLRHDLSLHPVQAAFFYLSLEHAESLAAQDQAVQAFEVLCARTDADYPEFLPAVSGYLDFARRHQAVIAQFGRFPHRNTVLGRDPTPEEQRYLTSGGERFGSAQS